MKRPQPGEYWKMRCGTVVYIVGIAEMLYLPVVSVDNSGVFHTNNTDGTAHQFLRRDSVADLVQHLPDYPGFPFPPDALRVPSEKVSEAVS